MRALLFLATLSFAAACGPKSAAPEEAVEIEGPEPEKSSVEAVEITEPELKSQLQASQSMRLSVSNTSALRDLLIIIEKFGGTAVDSTGRTLDEDALEKSPAVGVQILLPQDNVTSFTMALQQIGSVTGTGQNPAGLFTADQKVGLYVEVVTD